MSYHYTSPQTVKPSVLFVPLTMSFVRCWSRRPFPDDIGLRGSTLPPTCWTVHLPHKKKRSMLPVLLSLSLVQHLRTITCEFLATCVTLTLSLLLSTSLLLDPPCVSFRLLLKSQRLPVSWSIFHAKKRHFGSAFAFQIGQNRLAFG